MLLNDLGHTKTAPWAWVSGCGVFLFQEAERLAALDQWKEKEAFGLK